MSDSYHYTMTVRFSTDHPLAQPASRPAVAGDRPVFGATLPALAASLRDVLGVGSLSLDDVNLFGDERMVQPPRRLTESTLPDPEPGMAAPTRPARAPFIACPTCGEGVKGVEHRAGWIQRTMFGTRVGTYPAMPHGDIGVDGAPARLESLPELGQFVVEPCGDQISEEEAERIRVAWGR